MRARRVSNLRAHGEPHQQVVKQAISWLLRLRNNASNPKLQAQCERWRTAHPEHELAWQRVQSLQQELSANLRAVPGAQVALHTLEQSAQRLDRRQALKLLGGALLLGSAAWLGREQMGGLQWNADFATATGERRGFQLPDGTRLRLNTDSAANLDFTAGQRLIKLARGEIMVTCGSSLTPTPGQPLRVQSEHGLFEASTARFVVRQERDCTRLSVTSGSVAVLAPQATDGAPMRVQAGQSYLITPALAAPAPPLAMDPGAWVDGLIVTRNMRLADFLKEVSRYRRGHLACASQIADLRLSGVFRLEDTDKLLAIVAQTLPVQVRYRTRWWVTVERQV
jgi:ferric-dicitrate binding protein FerR (iron transport regulator)|nr:FecR family protein [Pseudomonas sp. Irchel 3H3]